MGVITRDTDPTPDPTPQQRPSTAPSPNVTAAMDAKADPEVLWITAVE